MNAPVKPQPAPMAIGSDNSLTIDTPGVIYDILISPNELFCAVLDKKTFDQLNQIDKELDEAAQELNNARTSKSNDHSAMYKAQEKVRNALLKQIEENPGSGTLAPLTTGKVSFNEVIRVGEQKYSLVPSKIIEELRKEPRRLFDLPKATSEAIRKNATPEASEDSLGEWRYTDDDEAADPNKKAGEINQEKVKKIFGQVQTKIAKEWKLLEYKKEGQISSALLAKGVLGPVAHFFDEDYYKSIDKWIEQLNKSAETSTRQYTKYRDKALAALDKKTDSKEKDPEKYYLPEDWDLAKSMVEDIWGPDDEFRQGLEDYVYKDTVDSDTRLEIRNELARKKLPSTMWDASAGAQFMRYSLGTSVKTEFNLLDKGKLALGAEAEFDAALAEAKAEGNFYYPHSEGHALKPIVKTKKEEIVYKLYGSSNDAGATYGLRADQKLPYFSVDCSLLTPAGAYGVLSTLKAWSVINQTGNRAELDLRQRELFIQVVGHTSATGSDAHNMALGQRRASVVSDFIQNTYFNWIAHFKNGIWTQEHLDFMAFYLLLEGRTEGKNIDWYRIGLDEKSTSPLQQLRKQVPNLDEIKAGTLPQLVKILFIQKDQWNDLRRSADPRLTRMTRLQHIIIEYCKRLLVKASIKADLEITHFDNLLKHVKLYSDPFISKGETELRINTQNEIFHNRRTEFLAWEIDKSKSRVIEADTEVYIGDMRAMFSGHISAWAGANVVLGGEIAVACPQGALAVVGAIRDEKRAGKVSDKTIQQAKGALEAGANAGAFAGAKAEAGLKAALDWRPPPDDKADKSKTATPPKFDALGSIGYTVTGMAGIGGKAELKIGFDQISQRFVVKCKAEAALGLGVGGQLNIVVGVGQCWDFVVLIHSQLKKNNFRYLDIFETEDDESGIDVFDLFSAWAWKMLKMGNPIGAAGTLAIGAFADTAISLLSTAFDIVDEWKRENIVNEQTDTLVDTLHKKPELIKYLTPETKARILYELVSAPYDFEERWDNFWNFDINKRREDAAILLLKEGTHSKTDWRETLEHLCEKNGDKLMPRVTPGATQEIKSQRANDNLKLLQEHLLNDSHKWQDLQNHITALPE